MSLTPFRVPIVPELRKSTIMSLISRGLRVEERDLYTPRLVKIETGVIGRAEGSAQVYLGKTQVLVGVKVDVGAPFKDAPDEGVISVNAEFAPVASPMFEPGPPDENAVELARVVDRGLRDSNAVDRRSLVIIPGSKVWVIHIDIYALNYDGNLFDASMLATIAALVDARLPDYEELETGEIVLRGEERRTPLKIDRVVATVNVAKIGDYLIVDPNLDEETVSDARLIVGYDHEGKLVGIQKSGSGSMTREEVLRAIDVGARAVRVYFKSLEEALGERLPVKLA